MLRRIYLDNAATSWPKPESVYAAVDHYQRELGAPSGRGGSRAAEAVARLITRVRHGIAQIVGIDDPSRVIFTNSGTDSLNTVILGILRPGDHVVTTMCEHNSVLRPLKHLSETAGVDVTYVQCDRDGYVHADVVRQALRVDTRLVAVVHGSNVTGAIQPVSEVGEIVRGHGAFYLIDAAQTLGEVPIAMASCGADFIAAPGHKGLLGPLGTGVLCLSERAIEELQPLRLGGTGTSSEFDRQPSELPHKFEAGNLNVPGLVGLAAGVAFLLEQGIENLAKHHAVLTERLLAGLTKNASVTVHGPLIEKPRSSVVSFTVEGYDPQELATLVEMTAGIECRAGLHCAPRMHQALGTASNGGTVRLSPGWSTTVEEIDFAVDAVAQATATG